MISIVLYDDESIIRIADRTIRYFAPHNMLRITEESIWLSGLYFYFRPRQILVNQFDPTVFSKEQLIECLTYVLNGERISIFGNKQNKKYIDNVNSKTNFDSIFAN